MNEQSDAYVEVYRLDETEWQSATIVGRYRVGDRHRLTTGPAVRDVQMWPLHERYRTGQIVWLGDAYGRVGAVTPVPEDAPEPSGRNASKKPHRGRLLEIVADPDEPHFPVCNGCGDPWPCDDHAERLAAAHAAREAEKQFAHEARLPHVCDLPSVITGLPCSERYGTTRGLQQHVRLSHDRSVD